MKNRSNLSLPSLISTIVVATAIFLGGCSSGNIAGPQPETPEAETVQNDSPVGQATTSGNGDGTAGQADHNTSPED